MAYPEGFEPRRTPEMSERVLDWRYWRNGDTGIAIVAVGGEVGDWAGYIGAFYHSGDASRDWHAVNFVAAHGHKLRWEEALVFFPEVAEKFFWRA